MSTIHCMPSSQCISSERFSPSEILRATNFSTSSSSTTGIENFITVTHSSMDSGVTWNTACEHTSYHANQLARVLTNDRALHVRRISSGTYRQDLDVEDDEVEGEGESHGADEPHVGPWGHGHQRLVLRQTVHGVQHLNCY